MLNDGRRAGAVDLRLVFTDEAGDLALLRRCDELLVAEERARRDVLPQAVDRLRYTLARAALREALSAHARVDPSAWRFVANRHGKPRVAEPREHRALSFNVSHAGDLVLVGVARGRALGVDVEPATRPLPRNIVDHLFAPRERDALLSLPPREGVRRFVDLWTLKESYVKARGEGLMTIPLDRFHFGFDEHGGLDVAFEPEADDAAWHWHFWQFEAGPTHVAAVCAHAWGERPSLHASVVVPGASHRRWPLEILRATA